MHTNTLKHYTESIYYDIEQAARYIKVLGAQLFERITDEFTCAEFVALDTISINNGICQRDLAKLILKDRANTGRLLDSLESKGYINRLNDTKNNRLIRRIEITEKGKESLINVTKRLEPLYFAVIKDISKDEIDELRTKLKEFCKILSKVVEMEI